MQRVSDSITFGSVVADLGSRRISRRWGGGGGKLVIYFLQLCPSTCFLVDIYIHFAMGLTLYL